jgi:hypothetical protein
MHAAIGDPGCRSSWREFEQNDFEMHGAGPRASVSTRHSVARIVRCSAAMACRRAFAVEITPLGRAGSLDLPLSRGLLDFDPALDILDMPDYLPTRRHRLFEGAVSRGHDRIMLCSCTVVDKQCRIQWNKEVWVRWAVSGSERLQRTRKGLFAQQQPRSN